MLRVFCIVILLPGLSAAQNPWKDIYSENTWEQRDKWQKPEAIIRLLELTDKSSVADIGSHEGYFTMKLAATVPGGVVYAVDISNNKLEKLMAISAKNGFDNVQAILGEEDDPRLPLQSVDAVLIVDTYHEIREPRTFLVNLRKALKPGAKLVICEPIAAERKGKPRDAQFRKHELESRFALADLKMAGYTVIRLEESFIDRTGQKGDTMWALVATP